MSECLGLCPTELGSVDVHCLFSSVVRPGSECGGKVKEGSDAPAVERAGQPKRDKNAVGILVVGVGATAATDGGCSAHFDHVHVHLGGDGLGPGGTRGTDTCMPNLKKMGGPCLSDGVIQSGSGCAEYITSGSCNQAATKPMSPARNKGAGSTFVANADAAGKDGSGVRALLTKIHMNASVLLMMSCVFRVVWRRG